MSGASGLRKHGHTSVGDGGTITGGVAEITDLPTAETDATLVLAPDGVGGVEFRAEAGGGSDPLTASAVFDDLFNPSATAVYAGGISAELSGAGAGATVINSDSGDSSHFGIIRLDTGTTTTGTASLGNRTTVWWPSKGALEFGVIFQLASLSNGTNRYIIRAGFGGRIMNGADTEDDGVYLTYSDNLNSGKWQAVCVDNGVATTLDTGVAAATGWKKLGFVLNDAATSVEFFINGTSVGTINTNVPTDQEPYNWCPMIIEKTAGTAHAYSFVDAYWYNMTLNPAR